MPDSKTYILHFIGSCHGNFRRGHYLSASGRQYGTDFLFFHFITIDQPFFKAVRRSYRCIRLDAPPGTLATPRHATVHIYGFFGSSHRRPTFSNHCSTLSGLASKKDRKQQYRYPSEHQLNLARPSGLSYTQKEPPRPQYNYNNISGKETGTCVGNTRKDIDFWLLCLCA
jgi:hypothetical protein